MRSWSNREITSFFIKNGIEKRNAKTDYAIKDVSEETQIKREKISANFFCS